MGSVSYMFYICRFQLNNKKDYTTYYNAEVMCTLVVSVMQSVCGVIDL